MRDPRHRRSAGPFDHSSQIPSETLDLALGFECREQIPGTNSFRLTQRKNLDAAQNLAGNSFPQARTVGNAGCSMAKLRDADRGCHRVSRRNLSQPLQKTAIWVLPNDLGKDVGIEQVPHRLRLARGLRNARGRCLTRAVTISYGKIVREEFFYSM